MGRIEKDKNLVKFWVDGKAKPYVLDINKGELFGLRGAALQTIPSTVVSLISWTPNKTSVMRLMYNGFRPSHNRELYQLADKLDALDLSADTYALRKLSKYISTLDFKDLVKYIKANEGSVSSLIDDYVANVMRQKWQTKNNLFADDHLTDAMIDWLYSELRDQSKDTLHRIAYYLTRGLWDFYDGNTYYMRECVNRFIQYTTALEIPMEKGDFFRQYINAKRAYRINEDALVNKSIAINQRKRLSALSFENETFMVVIPMSKEELRIEGENQHNCVGGYGGRIAEGSRNVVFIRRKSDPNSAYITCDILSDSTINQFLTKYNSSCTAQDALEFKRAYQFHLTTHWGE